jgi:hypothetical protein
MNETTITFSLSFFKAQIMAAAEGLSFTNYLESVSGTAFNRASVLVSNSGPTLIPYGPVTVPGRMIAHNLDTNNNLTLFNGSGGTAFLELLPSSWHIFYLAPAVVLYGQATVAPVQMEFLLISQ